MATTTQISNPWASIVGDEEYNPFTGELQMTKGEGQTDFRDRLATAVTDQQDSLTALLDADTQAASIKSTAESLTDKLSGDQMAGEAAEDVDSQYAGQEKAITLSQSRMGLDPSQNASQTSQVNSKMAQASARAGAIQAARRSAESQNTANYQSNINSATSLVNAQTELAYNTGSSNLSTLQSQGTSSESSIANARIQAAQTSANKSALADKQATVSAMPDNTLAQQAAKKKAQANIDKSMYSLNQSSSLTNQTLNGGSVVNLYDYGTTSAGQASQAGLDLSSRQLASQSASRPSSGRNYGGSTVSGRSF